MGVAIFSISAVACFYILAGYPLLLAWISHRHARPVRRAAIQPPVSIVVAVYNGGQYLRAKLESILRLDYPRDRMEILVASDGSTDDTESIAESFAPQGVRLLRLARGGKCAALNAAIAKSAGEIVVLTDVRQALDPSSLRLLVENFADPEVGAASGELVIRELFSGEGAAGSEIDIGSYWRFEVWMRDRLSAIDSIFGATGAFYAIRRNLASPIPADILLDDMYLPLTAFFRGYRLVMDSRARVFDVPMALDTEFRRKLRTLAGNYQILRAYPALLGPGNRMWLHFVSYKFGRLLLPWLLAAVALSSFALPHIPRLCALIPQAAFYGIAVIDPLIAPRSLIKRLSSPARTFVVMMIAAMRGLSVFVVPPRSLWKVTSAGPR